MRLLVSKNTSLTLALGSYWLLVHKPLLTDIKLPVATHSGGGTQRALRSSGGQFGKLRPYLFLIKKINDSRGCHLSTKCEHAVLILLAPVKCVKPDTNPKGNTITTQRFRNNNEYKT